MFGGFTEKDMDTKPVKKGMVSNRSTKPKSTTREKSKEVTFSTKPDGCSTDPLPPGAMLSSPPPSKESPPPPPSTASNPDIIQNLNQDEAVTEGTEVAKVEEVVSPPPVVVDERSKIEILTSRQKEMEKENKRKKELLGKAIAERKKQTTAENHKLQQLQQELGQIEIGLSSDVKLLRNSIEDASITLMDAKKRYDRAEAEFVSAKLHLRTAEDKKELLTEHLCSIIQKTEERKAEKLEKLMIELDIKE